MKIRLTDEEIESIDIECGMRECERGRPNEGSYYYEHQLNKAQLKKVVERGESECFDHPYESDLPEEEYNRKRHRCPECWQALKKEIE